MGHVLRDMRSMACDEGRVFNVTLVRGHELKNIKVVC